MEYTGERWELLGKAVDADDGKDMPRVGREVLEVLANVFLTALSGGGGKDDMGQTVTVENIMAVTCYKSQSNG